MNSDEGENCTVCGRIARPIPTLLSGRSSVWFKNPATFSNICYFCFCDLELNNVWSLYDEKIEDYTDKLRKQRNQCITQIIKKAKPIHRKKHKKRFVGI